MSQKHVSQSRPAPRRRRRRRILFFVALVAAGMLAGGIALAHMGTAGETTGVVATLPSPTATAGVTATPGTSAVLPTPSPTPYPAPLARDTVQKYWDFIARGEATRAYDLLSRGAQEITSRQQFVANLSHLIEVNNGMSVVAGEATVLGDRASVPITLHSTAQGISRNVQQLIWEGTWRIEEAGASGTPTPVSK